MDVETRPPPFPLTKIYLLLLKYSGKREQVLTLWNVRNDKRRQNWTTLWNIKATSLADDVFVITP